MTLQRQKTKIVCTLGPASSDEATIRRMVQAGMSVARLNFSHGTLEEHARQIGRVRRAAAAENRVIGILIDLPGPKIRLGTLVATDLAEALLKGGAPGLHFFTQNRSVATRAILATLLERRG